jgi:peptidyl-dipeptidase A
MKDRLIQLLMLFVMILMVSSCTKKPPSRADYEKFIAEFESWYIPLFNQVKAAEFSAAISGKARDYQSAADLNIELNARLANSSDFSKLKAFRDAEVLDNPQQKRELDLIYNQYLYHQIDQKLMKDIVNLSHSINQQYTNQQLSFKGSFSSPEVLDSILANSLLSTELEAAWKGRKQAAQSMEKDFIRLVKMRNLAAQSLGFKDYFDLQLFMSGHNANQLEEIYLEFDLITKDLYHDAKGIIDNRLSVIYSVPESALMPWHYQNQFFQDVPNIFAVNFNEYYRGKNLTKIADSFFKGIGLDLSDVYRNSNIQENSGEYFTFTSNIDRKGDVRINANINETELGMQRLLYESGMAAYEKHIDQSLSFMLREPSQLLVADAVATLFSRFSRNPEWLEKVIGVKYDDPVELQKMYLNYLTMSKLVFARWAQVMYHFEKNLYKNPDQNLNELWWGLVKNYQGLRKPAGWENPDWISKSHLIAQPCTYHNYILGELLACQLYHYINNEVLIEQGGCSVKCINQPKVGEYFISRIFRFGRVYPWEELIQKSTGESLNVNYYKEQFVSAYGS